MKHLWLALIAVVLAACSSTVTTYYPAAPPTSPPDLFARDTARTAPTDADPRGAVADASNAFGFDLYHATETTDTNLIFSPFSISLAFSMLYGGARGETEAQLAEVLYFLPQDAHHAGMNALDQLITAEPEIDGAPEINVANAVWSQEGFPIHEEYLTLLAQNYGAGVRTVDFADRDATAEEIDQWVQEQTRDRIEQLFPPSVYTPSTRLVLANAVYFLGRWEQEFDPEMTTDRPFTLLDGSEVTVPMMQGPQDASFDVMRGEGYQALRVPYAGETTEMLVILPDEGEFAAVSTALGPELIAEIDANLANNTVALAMPRVETESELALLDVLNEMGFTALGDLSGISGGALFVADAIHKANITIDESGTEAAAVTGIMVAESGPAQFWMNRPFVLLIRERESGAILFLGHIVDPTQ